MAKNREQEVTKLIRDMELKDRYNSINNFVDDIFVITNPSTRRAEYDVILATIVLNNSKLVLDVIKEDTKIRSEDIDLKDLFEEKIKKLQDLFIITLFHRM